MPRSSSLKDADLVTLEAPRRPQRAIGRGAVDDEQLLARVILRQEGRNGASDRPLGVAADSISGACLPKAAITDLAWNRKTPAFHRKCPERTIASARAVSGFSMKRARRWMVVAEASAPSASSRYP